MRSSAILSIGTELTLGQTIDTNSAWLAAELAALGAPAELQVTVPDEIDWIVDAFRLACSKASTIIATGGLGPTADDLTRQALARTAGVGLHEDPDALRAIQAFFTDRGRTMPPANTVQALVPERGQALPNPVGTAPGLLMTIGRTTCFALPGVPREMKRMFADHVRPRLAATDGVIRSRVLRCCGLGESDIGARIADLMAANRNPDVGTTARDGIVGVRINARALNPADAERLLDQDEVEIRARLGRTIFGRDAETLSQAVGTLLIQRRATVATAESCTGGLIAKRLTDVPGSSAYLRGGVVAYTNDLKQTLLGVKPDALATFGAVSPAVAEQMAAGARERLATDYALSVTGIAGPGGGTPEKPVGLVYVGLAAAHGVSSRELRLGSESARDLIRTRTADAALDWLRRELMNSE